MLELDAACGITILG